MKKCEACGEMNRTFTRQDSGMTLCNKHHMQMQKFGKILIKKTGTCTICGDFSGETRRVIELNKELCTKHYQQYRLNKLNMRTRYDKNKIIIEGELALVVIYNAKNEEICRTIIDLDDVEKVMEHKWCARNKNYVVSTINGRKQRLHRFLLNYSGTNVVDHINRNPLDNRKSNLRIVSQGDNVINSKIGKNNQTGIIGVRWLKDRQRWIAAININKKSVVKYFKNKEDAISTRLLLEKEIYRDFAPQAHLFKEYNIA